MKLSQKLALQIIVGILGIIPLYAGANEFINGPAKVAMGLPYSSDLDSEFRFLSAFWFGAGITIYWMIPRILKESNLFTIIGLMIFVGGLGRVLSIIEVGWPDREILTVMCLELGVVPILVVWERVLAHRAKQAAATS